LPSTNAEGILPELRDCSKPALAGVATDASELAGLEVFSLKLAADVDLTELGWVEGASSAAFA
jgi:hypothetical protein